MTDKKHSRPRVFFDIETRGDGKYKILKYNGVIYGVYRSYKKLNKAIPRLRKLVYREMDAKAE